MYIGQHKIYPTEAFRRYMGKGIAIRKAIKNMVKIILIKKLSNILKMMKNTIMFQKEKSFG